MSERESTGFIVRLYEDEKPAIWDKLDKLGPPASMNKVVRALLVFWSKGEIELSMQELLSITPDARFDYSLRKPRGKRK